MESQNQSKSSENASKFVAGIFLGLELRMGRNESANEMGHRKWPKKADKYRSRGLADLSEPIMTQFIKGGGREGGTRDPPLNRFFLKFRVYFINRLKILCFSRGRRGQTD